jgi:peptide/nickel transport system permease protein
MRSYIIRRLLLFIPALIIISLLSFVISINAPGDPVERMMTVSGGSGETYSQSINQKEQYKYWQHRLGLDLPVFYFGLHSLAEEEESETKINRTVSWKNYVPVISFHLVNQYHRWLFGDGGITSKGVLRGDFGTSYLTKQPISKVIGDKIGWSLFFTLISILLAYIISIPIGIKAAAKKDSRFDRTTSIIFFILYSLPTFWVATLLMMTFANTDALNIFPASGVKPVTGYPADAGVFEKIKLSLPYLLLPTICYTYSSFAFLSRVMRVSLIEILSQDFIRTARAKGLPEKIVLWKHALRNSLLPVITVFANIFPFAIGGSVILESIFTIPGMGSEIYSSIEAQNYPMIIAVFTITGFMTMLGYLISDILYAIADPRISYAKVQGG